MTKDEARIVLLEKELTQAHHTISFLHGCLTYPSSEHRSGGYSYGYPEQTLSHLSDIEKLVNPDHGMCMHSIHQDDCEHCQNRLERWRKEAEALRVLDE